MTAARAARSTILDANAFDGEPDESTDDGRLIARRRRLMGPAYRLFYEEPVRPVRGSGAKLYDQEGNEYLDVYNNVASVGHAHPRVVEAIARQSAQLSTHTRYLSESLVDYAEDLLSTMPGGIRRLMLTCTGSEANDLAVRIARRVTGGTGIIITREAYHGNTELVSGLSPALGGGTALGPDVWTVPAPDTYRSTTDVGAEFARDVRAVLSEMAAAGVSPAALLVDTIFSSDGVYSSPPGFLRAAVDAVRAAGGVLIADEVQPGFGRTGSTFWGFQRHGLVPELVTMGKPMGNGYPIAAVAGSAEAVDAWAEDVPYFNTFGGNNVAVAAAQAVLDVIREEGLQEHASQVGRYFRGQLLDLATRHRAIGDVRGDGAFTGLELVSDPEQRTPDGARAARVVNGLRRRRVLTSVCGPDGAVLKLRPPLPFTRADADRFVAELDIVLQAED